MVENSRCRECGNPSSHAPRMLLTMQNCLAHPVCTINQLKLWQEQLRGYRDHITILDSLTQNVFLGLSFTALLCSFLFLCSECKMMIPVHFYMAGCDWVSC